MTFTQEVRPNPVNWNGLSLSLIIPLVLGVIGIFSFAANDQFGQLPLSVKTTALIVVAGGAIMLMLIALAFWSLQLRTWAAIGFTAMALVIGALLYQPIMWLFVQGAVAAGL